MNPNHHVAQLLLAYRAAFNAGFDPHAFRGDAFYASQVLDRALQTGSPELRAVAAPLEKLLLDTLYAGEAAGTESFDGRPWTALYQKFRHTTSPPREETGPAQPQQAQARPKAATLPVQAATLPVQAAIFPVKTTTLAAQATAVPAQAATLPVTPTRFADRDIFFISRLRLQYRRRFGTFFDIFEFTRNDYYARSLLMICAGSGDAALQSLAGRFSGRGGR